MKGLLYIEDEKLGEVEFKVIGRGMGAIGGELNVYPAYEKYRNKIQSLYEERGIANVDDFNFVIVLEDNTVLNPAGGVGVTDSAEFEEIYVESAGIDYRIIERIKDKG